MSMIAVRSGLLSVLLPVCAAAAPPEADVSSADMSHADIPGAGAGVTLLHLAVTGTVRETPDLLTATLSGTASAGDAAKAQRQLDAVMKTATDAAGQVRTVDWQVLDYAVNQIPPDTRTGRTLWTAQQTLSLRSGDAPSLLELVGRLQAMGLAVGALQWTLSPAHLAAAQQRAVTEALTQLRQRANAAAATLGLKVTGIRSVTLGEADRRPGPLPVMRMMEAVAAPPQATRGDAEISEQAEAVIALAP